MCAPCNNFKGSEDKITVVYKTGRKRVKNLRHKTQKQMRKIREERSQHYQPGTSDGGPVFMAFKKRYLQLKQRDKKLHTIDKKLKADRQKRMKDILG